MPHYVVHDSMEHIRREPTEMGYPDTILIEMNPETDGEEHNLKDEVEDLLRSQQEGRPVVEVKVEIGRDVVKSFRQEDMHHFNSTMLDVMRQCGYHWHTLDRLERWIRLTATTLVPNQA